MTKNSINFQIVIILSLAAWVLSGCSSGEEAFPKGLFQLDTFENYYEFFEDGTFTWGDSSDKPMIKGEYTIDGDKITFHSEKMIDGSPGGCSDDGIYTWEYKDKALSFDKVTDSCSARIHETDDKVFDPVGE